MNHLRLAAARARARQSVLPDEVSLLGSLEPSLWRIADTDGRRILAVAEDLQLHSADLTKVPVARLPATAAKALLAVLVATAAAGAVHPYPGRPSTVDEVMGVLGAPRLGRQAEAHVKGALNKLHGWRLVQLGHDDGVVSAEIGVPVRVGPAVALWSGPWVIELAALVARVAEQRMVG